ncbi:MAG: hypothetical protein C4325_04790 [Blastocatellia bacterium]
MKKQDIHIRFRDFASVNLLFALLEKNVPHFGNESENSPVETSGKDFREKIFLTLKEFSTNFPQIDVDENH